MSRSLNIDTSQQNREVTAWLVCLVGSLFFFYEFIQMNMFNAIDYALSIDFQLDAVSLSNLSSVFFISNVLFIIPAGVLLDRYSTKRLILINMGLCVLGTLGFACTNSYTIAYASRFITGVGSAFCFVSSVRLASRWFASDRLAFVTGIIITFAMFGGIIAQTPLTLLVEAIGWRHALLLDALLGVIITAAIFVIVKDTPDHEKSENTQVTLGKVLRVYSDLNNWSCGLFIALMNTPIALFGVIWGTPFLTHVYNLSHTESSLVISILFLGMIVGSPLFGRASDYLNRRIRPMQFASVIAILITCFICTWGDLPLPILMVLFFILGFLSSSQVLGYPILAERNSSELTATAISVGSFSAQLGCALFPDIYAKLLNIFSNLDKITGVHDPLAFAPITYQKALIFMPIGFILATAFTFMIKETYGKHVK